ncbi:cell division protein FtsQ [Geobacillus subterraneus]|uniref:Cell division protein DivIB n=2 Tax=Geobacillus TaxID=129337 RepID=A0ABN4NKY8_9BACL|nr:cell division protein FtsQ [Geobacillus subterraneus]KZS24767.1 cell division protein FtsQ [Geobacillus subterraneus]
MRALDKKAVNAMEKGKVVVLEDRVPKLKERRRQKANRRLILYLSFFFLFILCVLYFQSPLSAVKHVEVSGNRHLPAERIISLSGITKRTSFWKVNEQNVEAKIARHPEIKQAAVEKRLPNTIVIHVREWRRIAYVYNRQTFFPLLENGRLLKQEAAKTAPSDAPVLVGWKSGDAIAEMTGQLAELPAAVLGAMSEIHYKPNSEYEDRVVVYMNDGYEVSATIHNFADRLSHYPSIIAELDRNVKGVIHLEVGSYFVPYEPTKKEDDDETTSP